MAGHAPAPASACGAPHAHCVGLAQQTCCAVGWHEGTRVSPSPTVALMPQMQSPSFFWTHSANGSGPEQVQLALDDSLGQPQGAQQVIWGALASRS